MFVPFCCKVEKIFQIVFEREAGTLGCRREVGTLGCRETKRNPKRNTR